MKYPKQKKTRKKDNNKCIPNYVQMRDYLGRLQGWLCPIAQEQGIRVNPMLNPEIHHGGLHNRKENRQRFPLFIHSVFNLYLTHKEFHDENRNWGKISAYQADKIEQYIIEHRDYLDIGFFKNRQEVEDVIREVLNNEIN